MAWWLAVLLWGFGLNAVWENWHSVLYVHYRGRPITGLVLLRAALVDSFIILGMIGVARVLPDYRLALGVVFGLGVGIAIALEKWALASNRWAYTDTMYVLPFVKTGVTPTVQLGLIGVVVYVLTR